MVNYRCQTTIKTADNVSANFSTNTTHFSAVDDTDLVDIETQLVAFYNQIRPYFGSLVAQNNHGFKWYNLEDPEPRAPVRETAWNLTVAPSGQCLPPEVAVCVSYQAARISGQPQARRRNRFYLGPLASATVGSDGRVLNTTQSGIRNAAQAILTASDAAADWTWGIFSTIEIGLAPVTDGWVDNEFDTQRRRGRPYTIRSTFT